MPPSLRSRLGTGLLILLLSPTLPSSAVSQTPDSAALADSAQALWNAGMAAYESGTLEGLEKALEFWIRDVEISRQLGDRSAEGTTLNNLGVVYAALGRLDSALVYYGQALAIRRKIRDRSAEATTLYNVGSVHADLGSLDSALVYFGEALAIAVEVGDRSSYGLVLNEIGFVHTTLGRPDSALTYFGKALEILRDLGDRVGEGMTLNNIALTHRALDRPDSALVHHDEALTIVRAVGDRAGEAATLNNIGLGHFALGRPDSALVYYGEALAIVRDVGNRSGEAMTLNNIGLVHSTSGRPDSALASYGQALAIAREVGVKSSEGLTLLNIAGLYHRSSSPPDLEAAIAYYDSAAVAKAQISKATGSDANRLSHAEQDLDVFEHWTLAWLAMATPADREPGQLAALAASERGRSQALLDLMRGRRDLEAGRDMPREGRQLIAPLTHTGTPSLYWMVTQDTLLTWLIAPSGQVRVTHRVVSRDSIQALVSQLRRGLGVGDAAGRARLAGGIGPRLEGVRGSDSRRRGGELDRWPSESALRLSELLIPEEIAVLLPESGELVLVPHGPLNLIPFAALPTGETGLPLGAKHALRFTPSLATLGEAETGRGARRTDDGRPLLPSSLVVGNPGMPEVSGVNGPISLSPLPGAETEGRWVADLVGTDLLTGPGATERTVREQMPEALLIHLATHGFAYSSEARARDSFVALAPDGEHDGLLTVGEVLDDPALELAAELVVLSACQTGLGDLKQSEGTVGLQRAFLARGARSVLVSLWGVSDQATDLLMRGFYKHWLEDADAPSKAEALRRAQEHVRTTSGYEHPRFWAGFQLVGAR